MAEDIFDQECFATLVGDVGEGPSRRALGLFLVDVAERLDRLGDGAAGVQRVENFAHSVKSSAAMFGFNQLSALARKLEADTQALPAVELSPRLDELRAALARVRTLISDPARLARPGPP